MSKKINREISLKELLAEPNANGLKSDYKDYTDPKYIGPGTWDVIHRVAFKARTHDEQLKFIELMKTICYGFHCTICKDHCTEYIKNHPMEEYLDILVEINSEKIGLGLFVWSWKFHNSVNARIGKPIMNWDTAYNIYGESGALICSKNCMEAENNQEENSNITKTQKINDRSDLNTVINYRSDSDTVINRRNILEKFRLISINRN
jgi:hypothetical protein